MVPCTAGTTRADCDGSSMIEEPVAQSGKGERHGPWKYHLKTSTAEAELYHLDRDPSEMYNVLDRYLNIAHRLEKALRAEAKHYEAKLRDKNE